MARIAALYAAHPKGSLTQKVIANLQYLISNLLQFTAQLFKQALPFKYFYIQLQFI